MGERERVLLSALAGATIGAALGFFMLTGRGRLVRGQIEPKLDEFLDNVHRLKSSVRKARVVAEESWQAFQDIMEEATPRTPRSRDGHGRHAETAVGPAGAGRTNWESGAGPH